MVQEGGQAPPTGHELDGADGVLVVIAAQPVGGVVLLGEVLEDLHEGQWEDACDSPDSALRKERQGRTVSVRRGGSATAWDAHPFVTAGKGRRGLGSLMQRDENRSRQAAHPQGSSVLEQMEI